MSANRHDKARHCVPRDLGDAGLCRGLLQHFAGLERLAPGGIGKTCGRAWRCPTIDIGVKRHAFAQGAAEHGVNGQARFLPRHVP